MGRFYAKSFEELTGGQVYEILKSRSEIFMLEQCIHCLDMDDVDYRSIHFFIEENGRVIAYLRAFYDEDDRKTVRIGRVLSLHHRKGLGSELMAQSLSYIKENMQPDVIAVHSQEYICCFYEKFGFKKVSDPFLEEGVPHVSMELRVQETVAE